MRNGFDGLAGIVRNHLKHDPLSGDVFIFINNRGTHLKLLYCVIAPLERPIPRCMASAALLAMIFAHKYVFHLPLYRILQQIIQMDMSPPVMLGTCPPLLR